MAILFCQKYTREWEGKGFQEFNFKNASIPVATARLSPEIWDQGMVEIAEIFQDRQGKIPVNILGNFISRFRQGNFLL